MSLAGWLNRPSTVGWVWRPGYEFFYSCLKCAVAMACGPLFRVRRVGRRAHLPLGGVILCPNHASYLDPAFVQLVVRRRITFVMTNDFYQLAWGRWFFKLVGAVPIGRGRMARKGLRRAMALLRRGHAVVLFPEGRLSLDGSLGRPQRGVGVLARATGAPVIPVAIAGSLRAWPKGARRPRRARVRIAFGRPIAWDAGRAAASREGDRSFAERTMACVARLKARLEQIAPDPASASAPGSGLQPR